MTCLRSFKVVHLILAWLPAPPRGYRSRLLQAIKASRSPDFQWLQRQCHPPSSVRLLSRCHSDTRGVQVE